MPMTYSGTIINPLSCPVGEWTTVVPALKFPSPTNYVYVHALVYLNVTGQMIAGRSSGIFDVRAVRTGADADDTAWGTYSVESVAGGGAFATYVTHTWIGKNPGAFYWQLRPRIGIARLQVNTRYSKGMS